MLNFTDWTNFEKEEPMAEEIMTIEECAKYLKTSVSTIYRLAQQGKIPATKVGNQWRFQKKKIDEWLEKGGNLKKRRDHEQKRSI